MIVSSTPVAEPAVALPAEAEPVAVEPAAVLVLLEEPQAAKAVLATAAPISFRKLLREIFIMNLLSPFFRFTSCTFTLLPLVTCSTTRFRTRSI
jgi:hypothetical protein